MIDTSGWKEFRIGDVFALKGGFYNKKPEHSTEGDIPFLAATENENGVTEFYSYKDIMAWDKVGNPDNRIEGKLFPAHAIAVTVNGACCNAFYQPQEYTCSHDITSLQPKDGHILTAEEGLFICTVIKQEQYRWSYGRKPHDLNKLATMTIKLPVTQIGEPDWKYMEDFMGGLHCNPITTSVKSSHIPLETEKWGEFRVGDLFEIIRGQRYIADDRESGEIPYFSASQENNGLTDKISNPLFVESNALIYSTFGDCYYVQEKFTASDEISILKHPKLNTYTGLFIATILTANKYKYQFGRKAFQNKFINEHISLPVADDGSPNWQWMENYMKSLPFSDRI